MLDRDFERFWSAYPRKANTESARKAWHRLKPDIALVLRAVQSQIQSEQWTRDEGRFIPHPATWLNGSRWQDEIPPALRSDVRPATVAVQFYEHSTA